MFSPFIWWYFLRQSIEIKNSPSKHFFHEISGATPPRARRRNHAPVPPAPKERDPLLEADREAERKYRELIREAEKLLVTVSRAPLEPPHNPRVRELRATEVEAPRWVDILVNTHIRAPHFFTAFILCGVDDLDDTSSRRNSLRPWHSHVPRRVWSKVNHTQHEPLKHIVTDGDKVVHNASNVVVHTWLFIKECTTA